MSLTFGKVNLQTFICESEGRIVIANTIGMLDDDFELFRLGCDINGQ